MAWFTEEERERVKAFIANPNGAIAREARPANGARRRRTKPTSPREKKADAWCEWFHRAMRESGGGDPAAHLPDREA